MTTYPKDQPLFTCFNEIPEGAMCSTSQFIIKGTDVVPQVLDFSSAPAAPYYSLVYEFLSQQYPNSNMIRKALYFTSFLTYPADAGQFLPSQVSGSTATFADQFSNEFGQGINTWQVQFEIGSKQLVVTNLTSFIPTRNWTKAVTTIPVAYWQATLLNYTQAPTHITVP